MKRISYTVVIVAAAIASALPLVAQEKRVNSTGGASPHETLSTVFGDRRTGNRVTITYGRPFTKDPRSGQDRKIFGTAEEKALVPYGKANRLGADEATLLITQQPITLGDAAIPAGAYTLYLVPAESGPSKLAISTSIGKWGVPVDETHDLARVDLKKETLEKPVDQLTMAIEKDAAGGGLLKIMWEKTQFSVPIAAKK